MTEPGDRETPPELRARALGDRFGDLHAQLCDRGEASLASALAVHGAEARLAQRVFAALGGAPRRIRRFQLALQRLMDPTSRDGR